MALCVHFDNKFADKVRAKMRQFEEEGHEWEHWTDPIVAVLKDEEDDQD